eukprot:TRINITY_DN773103_c0_g1_i1.p1 TRINITY_DN773103_c0_g1~~TRINITY_DN773103_c0_g1_i1.p1  ORF type:complete len:339 (+),score=12.05 TRINITY_DN773103_c0_g1_i1:476-1492(+)
MITVSDFGKVNNEKIQLYTLTNKNGVIAKITNYGGILTSFSAPINGKQRELVLGFGNFEKYISPEYLENYPYFGAIIGRFGNRINKGKIKIGDKEIQLPCNHEENHLHGGNIGFDKKIWEARIISENELKLSYTSPDGEENFPGNLCIEVIYKLSSCNELQIHYHATTDKSTPINLTQHTYFNLSEEESDILAHKLQVDADYILETDDLLIPSGKLLHVENTCFDFRKKKSIKQDIAEIENYDDCFAFNETTEFPRKVAELSDKNDSICMEVSTTFPGLQVYTGKFINVEGSPKFDAFSGIALEAQGYPDAPNHPNFKHGWLHPGETYQQQTNYKLIF